MNHTENETLSMKQLDIGPYAPKGKQARKKHLEQYMEKLRLTISASMSNLA